MSLVRHVARAPSCQARYQEHADPDTRLAVKIACFAVAVALVAAIALPVPVLVGASVGVCLVVAAFMFVIPRAWPSTAASAGAMTERVCDPYWNSETFTFALVGGLLVAPVLLGTGILSMTIVITLITALLLAAFTPFCVGRLTYALLFHRDDGVDGVD